ncbi:DUF5804 family protein [Natronoglomus mannanivorans]|uniref:DUF5804 family protein n=1 Tax=Natronoglomus mannanivorans TaxID=2979990 RepID=A0AAP2YYW8_9EURY|nr:DUF5804 family protein [Halobacteria archaeon AArc-xg1-1]
MTRVCLLGSPEVNLQYELLSRETSRDALATYDLERPFENALALRTVSVGAAVSLLNDLQWYLVRFVDEAIVQEPSVSETEWLSRGLAEELRNGETRPDETGEFLKVYGLEAADAAVSAGTDTSAETETEATATRGTTGGGETESETRTDTETAADAAAYTADRLVEPLYVRRTDGEIPEYDLRDVDDTLVVRLTEGEFSP